MKEKDILPTSIIIKLLIASNIGLLIILIIFLASLFIKGY